MTRFKVTNLSLPGLKLIERIALKDERGFLSRLFCADEFLGQGWSGPVAQVNHTSTLVMGSIRGLHYQEPPYCDTKLVSCIRGEIWDVVVDLRLDSPTFMKFHGQLLSEDNCCAMLIPKGFAHGFQASVDNCELIYLHSSIYQPTADRGLRYDDPMLNINWPYPVTLVSQRDKSHPLLSPSFHGIKL